MNDTKRMSEKSKLQKNRQHDTIYMKFLNVQSNSVSYLGIYTKKG